SPADDARSTAHGPRSTIPPRSPPAPRAPLLSACRFLSELARAASRLDNYARVKLLEDIDDMAVGLSQNEGAFDALDWLAALPDEVHIGGSGPLPGCVHVADLSNGGHSGRPHTFIVGLDDRRFPGPGLEDPVLLDRERHRLSQSLPTAAASLRE